MNKLAKEFLKKRNERVASGSPIKKKIQEPAQKHKTGPATVNTPKLHK